MLTFSGMRDSICYTSVHGITTSGAVFCILVIRLLVIFLDSLEILKDWIDLIDEDGWVAREQILGEEARSKVSEMAIPRSDPDETLCRFQRNFKHKCPTTRTHPL